MIFDDEMGQWRDEPQAVLVATPGSVHVVVPTASRGSSPRSAMWVVLALLDAVDADRSGGIDLAVCERALAEDLQDHDIVVYGPFPATTSSVPFRGLIATFDASTMTLARPCVCPHAPAVPGTCVEFGDTAGDLTAHERLHQARCGCSCSGLLRWAHHSSHPVPYTALRGAAVAANRVFSDHFPGRDQWEWWDEIAERSPNGTAWLELWLELLDGGSDADLDAVCSTAFAAGGPR